MDLLSGPILFTRGIFHSLGSWIQVTVQSQHISLARHQRIMDRLLEAGGVVDWMPQSLENGVAAVVVVVYALAHFLAGNLYNRLPSSGGSSTRW